MFTRSIAAWEAMHAHYDAPTYQAALRMLDYSDVVVDIGAGDLRFATQMAKVVYKVYALEINEQVLRQGMESGGPLPHNLLAFCADAREFEFSGDITAGVLLMRHCTYFDLYFEKLRKAGAKRLVTNARWGMNVEELDLHAKRKQFEEVELGWYACSCGATGFKMGAVDRWLDEMDALTQEVVGCPQCKRV